MNTRIYFFYCQLSQPVLQWFEQNYKLYKGRFYSNLRQKGPGWSFPPCHQLFLQSKIDSLSIPNIKLEKTNSFLYDIPPEWRQPFERYFLPSFKKTSLHDK